MTTFIFANNINTTLAGAVSTSATTITLASTANLPASIPSGSVLAITLNDAATRNNYEVVYATAISGATLTVTRAQEGTSALAWLVGDYAYSGPTEGQQAAFGQTAANNTWTGQNTFSGNGNSFSGTGNSFSNPLAVATALLAGQAPNLGQLTPLYQVAVGRFTNTSTNVNVSFSVPGKGLLFAWGGCNTAQVSTPAGVQQFNLVINGTTVDTDTINSSGSYFGVATQSSAGTVTAGMYGANSNNFTLRVMLIFIPTA